MRTQNQIETTSKVVTALVQFAEGLTQALTGALEMLAAAGEVVQVLNANPEQRGYR